MGCINEIEYDAWHAHKLNATVLEPVYVNHREHVYRHESMNVVRIAYHETSWLETNGKSAAIVLFDRRGARIGSGRGRSSRRRSAVGSRVRGRVQPKQAQDGLQKLLHSVQLRRPCQERRGGEIRKLCDVGVGGQIAAGRESREAAGREWIRRERQVGTSGGKRDRE